MSFNPNAAAPRGRNNRAAQAPAGQDDSWKAAGFINIYLPTKEGNGAKRKVGSIALRLSNDRENSLAEFLGADAKNLDTFVAKMIVEYNKNEATPEGDFDL